MSEKTEIMKQRIENFFDNMTREEFIEHLESAGFEVTDGTGRIIDDSGKDITDEILKSYKSG